jgi:hypothetical protein
VLLTVGRAYHKDIGSLGPASDSVKGPIFPWSFGPDAKEVTSEAESGEWNP